MMSLDSNVRKTRGTACCLYRRQGQAGEAGHDCPCTGRVEICRAHWRGYQEIQVVRGAPKDRECPKHCGDHPGKRWSEQAFPRFGWAWFECICSDARKEVNNEPHLEPCIINEFSHHFCLHRRDWSQLCYPKALVAACNFRSRSLWV
jgi:hypothetical protein